MTRAWSTWAAKATAIAASALAILIFDPVPIPALAAAPAVGGAAKDNTRLETLQIEIWPEYDRPAALVILRAELAADVGLPAEVSLRIPASAGAPAAVAYASEKKGRLLKLKYDQAAAADFITLQFTAPTRFFHVEFYDRFAAGANARSYKYIWPGDLPVTWLDVVVQEPAGASRVSVLPELAEKASGSDGLVYRSAQLGPAKRGVPLPIEIQYAKTDSRTSVEILKLNSVAADVQANAPPPTKSVSWLIPAFVAAVLLAIAAVGAYVFLWWRQRPLAAAGTARYCGKCRNPAAAGDRFCAKCGAPLA